jgi:hypothetical protein
VFVVEVPHNSSPNSLAVHNHQSQYCALAWGSCASFQCSEVLGLRPAWKFSLLLKLAEMLNLKLAKFHEPFVELRYYFGPPSN